MGEPGCDGTARVAARDRIPTSFTRGMVSRFRRDAGGATAIEYALISALIFLAIAGSLRTYGSRVNGVYTYIGTVVTQNN